LWKLNQEGVTDIIVVDELDSSEKWKNLVGKRFEDYVDKDAFLLRLDQPSFFQDIDAIVHFGACSSTTETNAAYLMDNNYAYSRRLAEWSIKKRKRFLYASSAATYGEGEAGSA
jgi:ADP-L-glycero-D-manno-heptose 6-epimerase